MDFESMVAYIKNSLSAEGYIITSQFIQYGVQIKVKDHENAAVNLNIYNGKKGVKLTINGKTSSLKSFIESKFAIGTPKEVSQQIKLADQIPEFEGPWIGTDESGKGDFFGPLVVAGVGVDESIGEVLAKAGVKDCKLISDKKIRELAIVIRDVCKNKYVELELSPQRYNSLYQGMKVEGKNLNHLLAWGHARVIEDMLNLMVAEYVVADQFADEKYIESRLMEKGRSITLIQVHKAERNIAVAAASILARDRFLASLEALSETYHIVLPKGASQMVVAAGKEFVMEYGSDALSKVCKLHFRTVENLL